MSRILIKRALSLIVSLLMTAALTSCGASDKTQESTDNVGADVVATYLNIAFVRDEPTYAYAAENDTASSALSAYAKERGFGYSEFTVDTPNEDARLETFNTAITLGANVIVCVGRYMQKAVAAAQDKYPETSFLVVCGEEPNREYGEGFSENTHCIVFREEDAGYVAGYIALYEGARAPAFFAFSELSASVHCFGGFVAGVTDAAAELGLSDVKIICSISNDSMVFDADPDADVPLSDNMPEDLFEQGADMIAAMGAQVNISEEASYLNGTKIISVCFDAYDPYGVITTSPAYDCGRVAVKALDRLAANGGKWSVRDSGVCGREGLAEGGITLKKPSSGEPKFGEEDLMRLEDAAAAGEISIPLYEDKSDITSDKIPIIYIGK